MIDQVINQVINQVIDLDRLPVFLAAALLIAATPGPGLFYVAARALAGGRREGLASSIGLALGGLVHVAAGAVGVSALVMASAQAFALLKLLGAIYLVWLGWKAWRDARVLAPIEPPTTGAHRVLRDGMMVEALNPKTAGFFLAFIPQFVDPARPVAAQFIILGLVSVTLNTAADILVACWAAMVRRGVHKRPRFMVRARQASGLIMCGLGVSLLFARRPA